jgi:hypothetical protein
MAEAGIDTDFVGGPCAGVFKKMPVSQLATGAVICADATYVVTKHTPTFYTVTYAPDTRAGAPGQPLAGVPQFGQAWSALMHTLAFKVPAALKRERVALQRIRKAVR